MFVFGIVGGMFLLGIGTIETFEHSEYANKRSNEYSQKESGKKACL